MSSAAPADASARSTYRALAEIVRGAELGHLVIATMDEHVVRGLGGDWQLVPADTHYSCRRFAREEIVAPLDTAAGHPVRAEHICLPDPSDPPSYGRRLKEAGGVDHLIVASGASDGHVAFVKPGMPLDSDVSIIRLALSTRRDNMATFPEFSSLDEVPTHGVSVGLGTMLSTSRRITLVIHGVDKQLAGERVLAATDFDVGCPATFIHRCQGAQIWIDEAALSSTP